MKKIVILDAGIETALGDLETTWEALLSGKTGLSHQLIPGFEHPFPLGLIEWLPLPLGSSARLIALLNTCVAQIPELPGKTALICATTKGAIDEILPPSRDPDDANPLHITAHLAKKLPWIDHYSIVSAACASGTLAIIRAGMHIRCGDYDNVIVIGIDLISTFVLAGFASLQALAPEMCRPFDRNRNGLSLGEGAGWMILTGSENVPGSGYRPQAYLNSWGIACDATHITAPCRKASGLIAALKQTLKNESIPIGGVNAHGTGTRYNDAMELLAYDQIAPVMTPIHSIKGALGHCLGAAGVIEAALTVRSLAQGMIPPTAGLLNPEETKMVVSGTTALPLQYPSILSCNSGFGGINSVILLKKP